MLTSVHRPSSRPPGRIRMRARMPIHATFPARLAARRRRLHCPCGRPGLGSGCRVRRVGRRACVDAATGATGALRAAKPARARTGRNDAARDRRRRRTEHASVAGERGGAGQRCVGGRARRAHDQRARVDAGAPRLALGRRNRRRAERIAALAARRRFGRQLVARTAGTRRRTCGPAARAPDHRRRARAGIGRRMAREKAAATHAARIGRASRGVVATGRRCAVRNGAARVDRVARVDRPRRVDTARGRHPERLERIEHVRHARDAKPRPRAAPYDAAAPDAARWSVWWCARCRCWCSPASRA